MKKMKMFVGLMLLVILLFSLFSCKEKEVTAEEILDGFSAMQDNKEPWKASITFTMQGLSSNTSDYESTIVKSSVMVDENQTIYAENEMFNGNDLTERLGEKKSFYGIKEEDEVYGYEFIEEEAQAIQGLDKAHYDNLANINIPFDLMKKEVELTDMGDHYLIKGRILEEDAEGFNAYLSTIFLGIGSLKEGGSVPFSLEVHKELDAITTLSFDLTDVVPVMSESVELMYSDILMGQLGDIVLPDNVLELHEMHKK